MIPHAFLDELRARVPVSEVVGKRVKLRKVGREWKGLSPFNKERSPSFFVNDHKRFWHCFSSSKHGDIFGFVMETEGVGFPEAVERLASLAGMSLPDDRQPRVASAPAKPTGVHPLVRQREVLARRRKAVRLWKRSRQPIGTPVETYLRARGYRGPIPATIRYLPANGDFPPALIAAFGIATEPEPGVFAIADDAVLGVHLIKLRPDGSDRLRDDGEPAKITIGRDFVAPIVLAPPSDLLAIAVAEGIEDALNDHQATGRGAWAAGSASRMPALAAVVPGHIESVTVLVDDNKAGRDGSTSLAAELHARGIEVLLTPVGKAVTP